MMIARANNRNENICKEMNVWNEYSRVITWVILDISKDIDNRGT